MIFPSPKRQTRSEKTSIMPNEQSQTGLSLAADVRQLPFELELGDIALRISRSEKTNQLVLQLSRTQQLQLSLLLTADH